MSPVASAIGMNTEGNPSQLGVVPAQQGFAADRAPRSGIDDRLVFYLELAIRQGELQIMFERDATVVGADRAGV